MRRFSALAHLSEQNRICLPLRGPPHTTHTPTLESVYASGVGFSALNIAPARSPGLTDRRCTESSSLVSPYLGSLCGFHFLVLGGRAPTCPAIQHLSHSGRISGVVKTKVLLESLCSPDSMRAPSRRGIVMLNRSNPRRSPLLGAWRKVMNMFMKVLVVPSQNHDAFGRGLDVSASIAQCFRTGRT